MNMRQLVFWGGLIAATIPGQAAAADQQFCSDTSVRRLRVSMYPFIPGPERAAFVIKEAFERGCPGLTLEITLDGNYYDSDTQKGILFSDADVYEVDSVFFDDFVNQHKVQGLSQKLIDAAGPTVAFARDVSTSGNTRFGVPHWLCTDFLIYRNDEPQLGTLRTPADAQSAFRQLAASDRLLMDVKGTSTLGELYLSILVAHYGLPSATQKEHLDPDNLDPYATGVLTGFVNEEPPDYGRDADYHGRDGFYARQFARRAGSAFVGYSEDTFYALTEIAQSCRHDECLTQSDINVAPWPFADEGLKPVAWVDMYMVDSKATGVTLRDAEAFITFMMSLTTYENLLVPPDKVPRYLLPARADVFENSKVLKSAPLYSKFRPIIDQAVPVTAPGLNDQLRKIGAKLDSALPAQH